MFLLGFLLLVKQVYAAYYENPFSYFFYSIWDGLWYSSFPYGSYSTSLGYILLVTAFLYAIIYPLSRQIKVFQDKEHKNAAVLFSAILAFLISWASPFAEWLQFLLYDVAWLAILLLTILLLIGIYFTLGSAIGKARKAVSESSEERYVAKTGAEEAKKRYVDAKSGKKSSKHKSQNLRELEEKLDGKIITKLRRINNKLNSLGPIIAACFPDADRVLVRGALNIPKKHAKRDKKEKIRDQIKETARKMKDLENETIQGYQNMRAKRDNIYNLISERDIESAPLLIEELNNEMDLLTSIVRKVRRMHSNLERGLRQFNQL